MTAATARFVLALSLLLASNTASLAQVGSEDVRLVPDSPAPAAGVNPPSPLVPAEASKPPENKVVQPSPEALKRAENRLPSRARRIPVIRGGAIQAIASPLLSVPRDPWADLLANTGVLASLIESNDAEDKNRARIEQLAADLAAGAERAGGPDWKARQPELARALDGVTAKVKRYFAESPKGTSWYQWSYYSRRYDRWGLQKELAADLAALGAVVAKARQAGAPVEKPLSTPSLVQLPAHIGAALAPGTLPQVTVKSPSGKTATMSAYPIEGGAYAVRLMGGEKGKWTVTTKQGDTREVELTPAGNGIVRVDPNARNHFARADGTRFVPVGLNICWVLDGQKLEDRMAAWAKYLDAAANNGANWVRLWCCPWGLAMETKATGLGKYDQDSSTQLDRLFELAAKRGIYLQLCIDYHGNLAAKSDWDKNPYNAVNGGPCKSPGQFFSSAEARRMYKRRLDYLVARYAAHENLFAWEFFNEVDLTDLPNPYHIIRWHAEMAEYLKKIDPYKHMVTTSTAGESIVYAPLWLAGKLDFAQVHIYQHDLARSLPAAIDTIRHLGMPALAGEAGQDSAWEPYVWEVKFDPLAIGFHDALFAGLFGGSAGTGMFWWWDNYIVGGNHWPVMKPAAIFAKWLESSTGPLTRATPRIDGEGDNRIRVRAVEAEGRLAVWLKDIDFLATEKQTRPVPARRGPYSLEFDLERDGTWEVTRLNTWSGEQKVVTTVKSAKKKLVFSTEPFERDVAYLAVRR